MQITRQTETPAVNAFLKKLEDHPGGITVSVAALVAGAMVLAGTVVGRDNATGLFHIIKSVALHANAANNATTYQVKKGHHYKVGDSVGVIGDAAQTITAIDTSNAAYDVLTLDATLGVALTAGDSLTQANADAADNAAFKYQPYGLIGHGFEVVAGDNHLTDCIVRGTAVEANIPPVSAAVKAALPHFRFV